MVRNIADSFGLAHVKPQSTSETPSRTERLVLNRREACVALGLSATSMWRLEARGLIRPVPHLRTKLYSLVELQRFLNQESGRAARPQQQKGGN